MSMDLEVDSFGEITKVRPVKFLWLSLVIPHWRKETPHLACSSQAHCSIWNVLESCGHLHKMKPVDIPAKMRGSCEPLPPAEMLSGYLQHCKNKKPACLSVPKALARSEHVVGTRLVLGLPKRQIQANELDSINYLLLGI